MARFYADEDVDYDVVLALRRLGHDVLTAQEAGRANLRIPDNAVLADAAGMGRVMSSAGTTPSPTARPG